MKIFNDTHWTQASLRKIFGACLTELRRREGKTIIASKFWRISVVNHRTNWVGGFAHYHSISLTMKLPTPDGERFRRTASTIKRWPPKKSEVEILKPDLKFSQEVADVFFHELGHCMGVRHAQTRRRNWRHGDSDCRGATIEKSFAEWIEKTITDEFILQEKLTVSALNRDVQVERYLRAVANLKRAETRHKRSTTLLRKWRKKVHYYDMIRGPIPNLKEEE